MAVLNCLGWSSRAPNKSQLISRIRDSKIQLPMKGRHGHRIAAGKERAFTEFLLCADSKHCRRLEERTQDIQGRF